MVGGGSMLLNVSKSKGKWGDRVSPWFSEGRGDLPLQLP